ncbi:hypothetical protein Tco_0161909 [Tanacetum coccineum]
MASLDYRLNPLYAIRECSPCGALYNKSCGCSKGGLIDKFVRNPNKMPDLSQRPPIVCVKCGNPVEGPFCQGCALWRKKLKEVWFTTCHENGINQDLLNTFESSDDDTNVVNAPREPFVMESFVNNALCAGGGGGGNVGGVAYDRLLEVPFCYDDDDDEESSIPLKDIISELPPCVAITPDSPKTNSLIMEDEHLDTILKTESDELIKSSIEDLVQIPSESEDSSKGECDLPPYDDSSKNHDLTFSNPLFDINEDFTSSDESFSKEDIPNENFKIFSNPLFDLDEEITSTKVDQIDDEVLENTNSILPRIEYLCFNAKSDLLESLLHRDTSINDSQKIDFLLDEFAGELTLLKSIPPRIDDDNLDPEGEIHLVERLLYDNSSPRPPKEFNSENPTVSFSPSPILVEDSDSLMEEIDIFLDGDKSIPPGIESDDFDLENDDNSTSHHEFESFHIDYPDSGNSTIDVVEDIPDPGICIEVESTRFLSTLSPVIDTLLSFSSENKDKVFNHGVLASKDKSSSSLSYAYLSACYAQVIWMKTQLLDYGYRYNKIPMYCDSKSAIAISCNLIQHSRTKHINTRYHFIKEHIEKGTIELYFVGTEYQLADLFTKALPKERFENLVHRIVIIREQPQQIILADKLVTTKYQGIGRCNNYAVLPNISCPKECKIVGWLLVDHALSYALTAKKMLQLCVSTPILEDTASGNSAHPFIAPATLQFIQPFLNIIGYQGNVEKVSAFYMKNLSQPWQTMFKVFNHCLTSITSGHDQTKINILHIFHAVINRVHVDYVVLLWWDFLHCVQLKKDVIQYPRFTKLIIFDLMKKFAFTPQRLEEDYHSIKNDIPLEYKDYAKEFVGVDVPTIQPQPVESTQGTNRTPRAPRTPNPATAIVDDVVSKKKKRKRVARETSSPRPSLKVRIKQKSSSITSIPPPNDDRERDEIHELGSHKDKLKIVDDDDEEKKKDDKKDDDYNDDDDHNDRASIKDYVTRSLEVRNEEKQTPISTILRSPRIYLSLDKDIFQELAVSTLPPPATSSKQSKPISKGVQTPRVDGVLNDIVPKIASNATNDLINDNLLRIVGSVVQNEKEASQATMKMDLQSQVADQELWDFLRTKYEKSSISSGSCITYTFRKRDHDDHHQDDAPPEGENRAKSQKRSKDWDAWVDVQVIDEDEVIPEDETPELIEENPNEPPRYLYNKDLFNLKYENTKEKRYVLSLHKIHAVSFPKEDLEERMKRWNDIEDMYYLCLNKKVNYREKELLSSLMTFIRNHVIWERVHDFRLRIESYHIKINLTKPTLIFPGIEACDPYSIVDKPDTGLIYLNNIGEKRVMNLVEIVKFCDATLKKVLKEVKLKIFETKFLKKAPLLGELDLDIMKSYEREITKRLSHLVQIRRWESFVNGRPILSTLKRQSFILSNTKDRWVWDLNGSGDFLVKDVRSMIDDFMLPKEPVATRWIKRIPIKVNVFSWKVRHDRLATKSNLILREQLLNDFVAVVTLKKNLFRRDVVSVGHLNISFFANVGGRILGIRGFHLYMSFDRTHLPGKRCQVNSPTSSCWYSYQKNIALQLEPQLMEVREYGTKSQVCRQLCAGPAYTNLPREKTLN